MPTYTDTERFLQAVFPDYGTHAILAHSDPFVGMAHFRGLGSLSSRVDCYWSVARFPDDHLNKRVLTRALDVRALVIDDVWTKVASLSVSAALGWPTAIVETSAGNYQWTYRLSKPVAVEDWGAFFAEIERLVGTKLEGRDAVHLFRLPLGVNTKPGRNGFSVRLAELNPANSLDITQINIAWGGRAAGPAGPSEPRIRDIRGLMKLIPNRDESYDDWISRAHQVKALALDESEGEKAFDEWSAKSGKYDAGETARRWATVSPSRTSGLDILRDAEKVDPQGFAAIMNREAAGAFDDGVDHIGPAPNKRAGIAATPFKWVDLAKTSPRDWLYGDILLRKFISMTVAPGGVGKSSLVAVETLAQVTGKALLGEDPSDELRVWLWNLEDPYEETQKKLLAAAKHYGITEADIGGRLFVDSGRDQRLVIAEMGPSGPVIVRPVVRDLVEQIRLRRIDVVVIDPFVSCHGVPENDNGAMDMVVKEWGRVAEEGGCAVHLVDHTRKAGAEVEVSTESSRGAKAKTDAARVVRVVNRMTGADGRAWGIVDTWRYFNTFNDKANMAPPRARREWFRMESVAAGNGGTARQAFSVGAAATPRQGDSVGVAVQWAPPSAQALAGGANFQAVVKAMGTQRWRASSQAKDWVGNAVAQGCGLLRHSATDLVLIKDLIKRWISDGLLREVSQMDENRKTKDYIEIAQVF